MKSSLRIVIIADAYSPLLTSAAFQIQDLAAEFIRQGHSLLLILPVVKLENSLEFEKKDGVEILRLRTPPTKEINYIRRTINELLTPFIMYYKFRKTPWIYEKWDGIVWYSPSIFLGIFAGLLKKRNTCKAYLIVRDIFPEWALDLGLMKRRLPYFFFSRIARYQYLIADIIGVQSKSNLSYFEEWEHDPLRKIQVLQNWLGQSEFTPCSIRINNTFFSKRKIFIYSGNMGIAQEIHILLDLAVRLKSLTDIGFLLIGRGSELVNLKSIAKERSLDNVLFLDEINSKEIRQLYTQCHAGIVMLNLRHKTSNIPGKFLSYMQNGLPVLAYINENNDLVKLIKDEQVGQVCHSNLLDDFETTFKNLLNQIRVDIDLPSRCRRLFHREYTADKAVRQIVSELHVSLSNID